MGWAEGGCLMGNIDAQHGTLVFFGPESRSGDS